MIEGRNTGYPKALAALKHNGSSPPVLKMDKDRGYLSVTIPIHPNFAPKGKKVEKSSLYEERIREAIALEPMTLSDISRTLGYKSISKKLSSKVKEMSDRKDIGTCIQNGSIKYFSIDD
ncbi:MAG: hypothetical protein KBS81_07500 [Spirochaetales bacterium]|nr:hypothetical protein [Candidatus Physcosoma equi]